VKRLYKQERFKKYNDVRSKKAIQELQASRSNRYSNGAFGGFFLGVQAEQHRVVAPAVFSIIENYEETIAFFNKINNFIDRYWYMNIDLADITKLTPDALLYLLTILDHAARMPKQVRIRGNAPKDKEMRELFTCSGFYKYVTSGLTNKANKDILSVESGHTPDPKPIGALLAFIREKFGIEGFKETNVIYSVLMDAMINVIEHAYTGINKLVRSWWLMAKYEKDGTIVFALVDNGRGIPTTIKKKYFGLEDKVIPDSQLIASTVKGENRSETGEQYRGQGLPKIGKYALSGRIKNLYICSRNGYYNVDRDQCVEQHSPFLGTLLTWIFVRKQDDN